MTKFPLIHKFEHPHKEESTPLPRGIKYQEYELPYLNESITIFVPLKESERFEAEVSKIEQELNRDTLKRLLHKFRGIRG